MPDTPQTVPMPTDATTAPQTVPIPADAAAAQPESASGPWQGLNPEINAARGFGKEALSTLGGATSAIGSVLNKIPGVGETLAPSTGLTAEKQALAGATQLHGAAEHVGAGVEEIGEWMLGDEALKGAASFAKIAKNAPGLLRLMEEYPNAAKLIMGTTKGAAIGGTQAGLKAEAHGEEPAAAAKAGAEGGAAGGAFGEAVEGALESKIARSFVNRSLGTSARDVTYGNPAKALLDENIKNPKTGDIESYKSALRDGASLEDAAQAAGGRIASINGKINELKPQLDDILSKSNARIPFYDVAKKPIEDARAAIADNPAMTQKEKDLADGQLGELLQSMEKKYKGTALTPEQANSLKSAIGDRVKWSGASAVGDEVKPVYRQLYGSLKNAVHAAVPEAGPLDERLTNLLSAWDDVVPLARKEEVGAGTGVTAGFVWDVLRRFESLLGRFVPALKAGAASPVSKAATGVAGEETSQYLQGENQ